MSINFLTNINWSSPTTIGIGIGVIVIVAVGSYLYWAWSEKKWPFGQ
jgi:hypothetical protein